MLAEDFASSCVYGHRPSPVCLMIPWRCNGVARCLPNRPCVASQLKDTFFLAKVNLVDADIFVQYYDSLRFLSCVQEMSLDLFESNILCLLCQLEGRLYVGTRF